jgi:hypothetical protein
MRALPNSCHRRQKRISPVYALRFVDDEAILPAQQPDQII